MLGTIGKVLNDEGCTNLVLWCFDIRLECFGFFNYFLILNHAKLCIFWIVLQLITFLVISKSLWQGRKDARLFLWCSNLRSRLLCESYGFLNYFES